MQKVDFENVAAHDLARHLDKRIETVLTDYMERCNEVGIDYTEATTKAITVLGHYFTIAAGGIDATEQEIVATCRWHYERMIGNGRPSKLATNAGPAKRRRVP